MSADAEVEQVCILFHDAYEAAAVGAGWETQERSRKPWADVPEANKETMRATVRAVLASSWLAAHDAAVRAAAVEEALGESSMPNPDIAATGDGRVIAAAINALTRQVAALRAAQPTTEGETPTPAIPVCFCCGAPLMPSGNCPSPCRDCTAPEWTPPTDPDSDPVRYTP